MDFVLVKDISNGIEKAKEVLYEKVDRKTVLFLSGGKTPKTLYEVLAKEARIYPAAIGMIDERFGKPFHENSNELMIKKSGFLDYLEKQNIPFYSMLQSFRGPAAPHPAPTASVATLPAGARAGSPVASPLSFKLTEFYDQTVRDLFFKFPKSIGIIGIGEDGHIASIFPQFDPPAGGHDFVTFVNHPKYRERITLTFEALSLLDFYLVFVFGREKKKALKASLKDGPIQNLPARFFLRPEISKKTLLITDQKI